MSNEKRKLTVNSGLACLLKDREEMLDNYDTVMINSGTTIMSSAVNAKLSAKGAKINCGDLHVRDIKGEVIQLDKGAIIDAGANLKDLFVIAKDDLLITKEGMKSLAEVEGLIALGKVYYPDAGDMTGLIKVSGEKRPYPDGAHVLLGDYTMEQIIANLREDKKHIWVSGRITALEQKALETARSRRLTFTCAKFFCYEALNTEYAEIINSQERILVPDGYEITGKVGDGELALYSKKLYVDGKFSMTEKDIPALQELEGIVVKGKASLPASAVSIFRSKGKAEDYFIFEGRLVEINGVEQFSHAQLNEFVKNGEKITLKVNGCLVFDDDVTPEDIECIASLSYNGTVNISGAAKAALALKVKTGNGFMGDPAKMAELTGVNLKDLVSGKPKEDSDTKETVINMGTYILA